MMKKLALKILTVAALLALPAYAMAGDQKANLSGDNALTQYDRNGEKQIAGELIYNDSSASRRGSAGCVLKEYSNAGNIYNAYSEPAAQGYFAMSGNGRVRKSRGQLGTINFAKSEILCEVLVSLRMKQRGKDVEDFARFSQSGRRLIADIAPPYGPDRIIGRITATYGNGFGKLPTSLLIVANPDTEVESKVLTLQLANVRSTASSIFNKETTADERAKMKAISEMQGKPYRMDRVEKALGRMVK